MLKHLNYLMPLNYEATDLKQVKENNNGKSYNFVLAFSSNQNGIRYSESNKKHPSKASVYDMEEKKL